MGNGYKYYFIYHKWNGIVYSQRWNGIVTVGGIEMPTLQKTEITEGEFYNMSMADLEAKYPNKTLE